MPDRGPGCHARNFPPASDPHESVERFAPRHRTRVRRPLSRHHRRLQTLDAIRTQGDAHGPSERWLTAHYQAGWKELPNRTKWNDYGFKPTKNLVARIAACTECHVGGPDRDVNHDLIAAGHPRLNFEYTRFHFASHYQRHWQEPADFELRAWFIGQVVNLRATVGLLQARAAQSIRNPERTPWPEFAEASCFACHQTIGREELRRQGVSRSRSSGLPPWQSWSTAMIALLPQVHTLLVDAPQPVNVDFSKLQEQMNRARPNAVEVERLTAALGLDLDRWLAELQNAEEQGRFRPITPQMLVAFGRIVARSALTDDAKSLRDYDWDFVTQHYLALTAAYHAAGGSRLESPSANWRPALDGLKKTLQFPRSIAGSRLNSPLDYSPAEALTHLRTLHTLTADPGSSR
jgi:hypothetical protein